MNPSGKQYSSLQTIPKYLDLSLGISSHKELEEKSSASWVHRHDPSMMPPFQCDLPLEKPILIDKKIGHLHNQTNIKKRRRTKPKSASRAALDFLKGISLDGTSESNRSNSGLRRMMTSSTEGDYGIHLEHSRETSGCTNYSHKFDPISVSLPRFPSNQIVNTYCKSEAIKYDASNPFSFFHQSTDQPKTITRKKEYQATLANTSLTDHTTPIADAYRTCLKSPFLLCRNATSGEFASENASTGMTRKQYYQDHKKNIEIKRATKIDVGTSLVFHNMNGTLILVTSMLFKRKYKENENPNDIRGDRMLGGDKVLVASANEEGIDHYLSSYGKKVPRNGISYKHLLSPMLHSKILNQTTKDFIASICPAARIFRTQEDNPNLADDKLQRISSLAKMQEFIRKSIFSHTEVANDYENCLVIYNPYFLDMDIEQPENFKITINLPSYRASFTSFHNLKKIKSEENQVFIDSHPWLTTNLTLSKIRNAKNKLSQVAILNSLDMACTAMALVYFERLILKNIVSKNNYYLFASVSLLLAAKFYGQKVNSYLPLLKELENKLNVTVKDILLNEFYVYKELTFNLYMDAEQVIPHFMKLQNSQDYLDLEFAVKQQEKPA